MRRTMSEKLVLDLETQREFSEVEGRKPELLGRHRVFDNVIKI